MSTKRRWHCDGGDYTTGSQSDARPGASIVWRVHPWRWEVSVWSGARSEKKRFKYLDDKAINAKLWAERWLARSGRRRRV
jgi:hypothetical protein